MSRGYSPHSRAIIKMVVWWSRGPNNGFIWAIKQQSQLEMTHREREKVKWENSDLNHTVDGKSLTIANNTPPSASEHTLWCCKEENKSIKLVKCKGGHLRLSRSIIYLWCGPFGERIGIAIPTNPHNVVIHNTANAPMVQTVLSFTQ